MVDLFAGPDGPGEGFAGLYNDDNSPAFKPVTSIEMDKHSHQTIKKFLIKCRRMNDRHPLSGKNKLEYVQNQRRNLCFNQRFLKQKQAHIQKVKSEPGFLGEIDSWAMIITLKKNHGQKNDNQELFLLMCQTLIAALSRVTDTSECAGKRS